VTAAEQLTLSPLPLAGAFLVSGTRHEDERGWFARNWCARELAAHGLTAVIAQSSFSSNRRAGTLRGLHFQARPHDEAKLVTCVRGRIWDVIVDLQADSPTFKRWHAEELDGDRLSSLYVPEGFAHGFQTLSENSEVHYQVSDYYAPESAGGVRWDDPAFGIEWPDAERTIIARDNEYPDFDPAFLLSSR